VVVWVVVGGLWVVLGGLWVVAGRGFFFLNLMIILLVSVF
jgi:hypothetical protein